MLTKGCPLKWRLQVFSSVEHRTCPFARECRSCLVRDMSDSGKNHHLFSYLSKDVFS